MRGLKKVFSTGQNPAGKISSAKSEETKAPTTRASVNMLVQKYLDRSALYPRPTREEEVAFFDREIRTVFEEKLKGTQVGKTLEDVITNFTKEVALLNNNYTVLKEVISDVVTSIRQNPQSQIAVADINPEQLRPLGNPIGGYALVDGHINRSQSISDMVDMSGGIRARVASVASDSSLVNSTVEKFSKFVDPDKGVSPLKSLYFAQLC